MADPIFLWQVVSIEYQVNLFGEMQCGFESRPGTKHGNELRERL
jgi:hypothetical protein